jgi:ketosteroid isomerase-like protein
MMTADEKRAIALKLVNSIGREGGFDDSLVTDDFTWWAYGVGTLNAEGFKALVAALRPVMPVTPSLTIVGTAAEGDRVAVEADGDTVLSNGTRYQNKYHWVVLFRDGRVCALKEFYDSKYAYETIGAATLDTLPRGP